MHKSSRTITLGAIGTLSMIVMAGCADPVTADCVDTRTRAADGSYQVVDDRFCDGHSHSGYTRVYGGTYSGGRVRGGTFTKPADVDISTRSGRVIQRGGFGGKIGGGGG